MRNMITFLKLDDSRLITNFVKLVKQLYSAFRKNDATLVEINPLVVKKNLEFLCLDAKISVDDNAHFRNKSLFQKHDYSYLSASEQKARIHDINYIKMEGEIACLVNGAGLAMATMDIIKLRGGSPANFLDIGGGASADQVEAALGLISEDPRTKVIYVNIFGGIMRCDVIAEGIVKAAKKFKKSIPLVIRLKGTIYDAQYNIEGNNLDAAKEMLDRSHLNYSLIDGFDESAKKAVEMANELK